ncbi:DNA mismatch repair endonuclease MutL [Desulfurispira natronophila]|uniref:DNA mismatch repair protein MutL n=1 Tax=Desulfurispira natronophila TaxID=682562 RepID=A0A7W7Y3Z8_9BACT|nr:DNA mismatch repair endonuclease MutL [Desulfurispira natronophila]MBB5021402.1 DNA mismatch repair protein MutL [Desulfurispira natronophila]
MKITILPDTVINQIAAGEVVERPVNVVKELVENALDAGATRIELAVERGGIASMTIADNGSGMSRRDLMLAIERHATSKISKFEDLSGLNTMGFRGEALPSIASVSKLQITSCEPDSVAGNRLKVHGGRIIELQETAANIGTRVEVANLFYNVPARKKFLRTPQTEQNLITVLLHSFALAHPHIAFHYQIDGKSSFQFPPADQQQRIQQVFGRHNALNLRHGESRSPEVQISLFLSRPDHTRSRRDQLYFFVNRRHVKDRLLSSWLQQAYRHLIPHGRHPYGVAFLTIAPELVDVNVHPSKTEVRFLDIGLLSKHFHAALGQILTEQGGTESPPVSPSILTSPNRTYNHSKPAASGASTELVRQSVLNDSAPLALPIDTGGEGDFSPLQSVSEQSTGSESASLNFLPEDSREHFDILGQYAASFIVAVRNGELLIVDQHAAMERINYEEICARSTSEDTAMSSEPLLFPHPLPLTSAEVEVLKQHIPAVQALGFGVEFIDSSPCLTSAPFDLPSQQALDTITAVCRQVLDDKEKNMELPQESMRQMIIKSAACHKSVKAKKTLNHQQMEELLERLFTCSQPWTCPHGRPVALAWEREKLCQMFLR